MVAREFSDVVGFDGGGAYMSQSRLKNESTLKNRSRMYCWALLKRPFLYGQVRILGTETKPDMIVFLGGLELMRMGGGVVG